MNSVERDYEIDNATGINHEGPRANTPVRRLTASSIIGDKVENPEGENLGKIDNLMVNLNDGKVEYAVLEFGSFLGIGGKLFAIPFTELQVDPVKEVFVLNRDKDYLKNMPGFDQAHWPDTNSHTYFNEVNTYWKTPRQTTFLFLQSRQTTSLLFKDSRPFEKLLACKEFLLKQKKWSDDFATLAQSCSDFFIKVLPGFKSLIRQCFISIPTRKAITCHCKLL